MSTFLSCSTCRVNMIGAGGDAAGWSIFFLLIFFMARVMRRERDNLDPELQDDYVPAPPANR